jgi:hypothetical protein
MPKKLKALEILDIVNRDRQDLFPTMRAEMDLEEYFNSGTVPTDGCDGVQSLGMGHRFLKRPMEQLTSIMLQTPGPLATHPTTTAEPFTAQRVKRALDAELNREIVRYYQPIIKSAAGGAMISGKSFLFRTDPRDFRFRSGRLIHDINAPADVHDDAFWRWSFLAEITLRELDHLLKIAERERPNSDRGWSAAGLRALKKEVVSKQVNGKKKPGSRGYTTITDTMLDLPFDAVRWGEKVEVIWFFCKSEGDEMGRGGRDRKIDFYVVSRYGDPSKVEQKEGQHFITRTLETGSMAGHHRENQQVLFYTAGMFDSVTECLCPLIVDSAITSNQRMAQLTGIGKQALHRLLVNEHVMNSLSEGAAFAAMPNYVISGGVTEDMVEQLQRNGINPHDALPEGVQAMDKRNATGSLGQILGLVQAIGLDIEQDSKSGEAPVSLGRTVDHQRKSSSDLFANAINESLSQFISGWSSQIDVLWNEVGRTLTRSPGALHKSDSSYQQVLTIQTNLLKEHGIRTSEYTWREGKPQKFEFKTRRRNGAQDRQGAFQQAQALSQMADTEKVRRYAQREMVAALHGDELAHELFDNQEEPPERSQVEAIAIQSNTALQSLTAMEPNLDDDPFLHYPAHLNTAVVLMKVAEGQGNRADAYVLKGISVLLEHAALDAARLPDQQQQQAMQQLQQVAQAAQQIQPLAQPTEEAKLQLDERKVAVQEQNSQSMTADKQSLIQSRESSAEMKKIAMGEQGYRDARRIADSERKTDAQIGSMVAAAGAKAQDQDIATAGLIAGQANAEADREQRERQALAQQQQAPQEEG